MGSGNRRGKARRRARPGVIASRSPIAAILAALALLIQLVVLPQHAAHSAPAAIDLAAAAVELKATFGDAAALCVQTDGKGGPAAPAGDCDDHCPLCRLSAEAATLVAPDAPALPARRDATFHRLGVEPLSGAVPLAPSSSHRARAPPFAV